MKIKLFAITFGVAAATVGASNAASTVSAKNFTSASVGNPIVDSAGVPAALNTIWASAGIFSTVPVWATASVSSILSAFTAIDSTPLVNSTFTGLFTGNDLANGSYPANFSGASSYVLVGNSSTLANSTKLAVYRTGATFTAVDGAGNSNVALSATTPANWVFGTTRSVTTQSTLNNSAFTTGVTLVPEPSTALLGAIGALGLLRRRRN